MNYPPPPRHLVDTIIPDTARDMRKYSTDPLWIDQHFDLPPADDKAPLSVVVWGVAIASIIAWAILASFGLMVWSIVAGG